MQMVGTQPLFHHLANKEKVTLQSVVTFPCTSRAGCMPSVLKIESQITQERSLKRVKTKPLIYRKEVSKINYSPR